MVYEYRAWDMQDKAERERYFDAIRRMRQEYMEEYKGDFSMSRPSIHYWAEEKYGFAMAIDGTGNYTADYTIKNPKKFMLFKIKYWK